MRHRRGRERGATTPLAIVRDVERFHPTILDGGQLRVDLRKLSASGQESRLANGTTSRLSSNTPSSAAPILAAWRFARGMVLYEEKQVVPFGPKQSAAPISSLWS